MDGGGGDGYIGDEDEKEGAGVHSCESDLTVLAIVLPLHAYASRAH